MRRIAIAVTLLTLAACGKPAPPPPAPPPPKPDPRDFSRPYLDEKMMFAYIASLAEKAPFLGAGGETPPEAEAFARKFGFADYAEFKAVDARITAARVRILGDLTDESIKRLHEVKIHSCTLMLQRTDLTDEERKAVQKDLLDALAAQSLPPSPREPGPEIAASDLSLVLKFREALDGAERARMLRGPK